MMIKELIAIAKVRSGKTQDAMANEMGHTGKSRLSNIAAGKLKADASEIVYLAQAAKMEPISVLAEIESERHPELASVWKTTLARMQTGLTSLYFALGGRFHLPRFSAR